MDLRTCLVAAITLAGLVLVEVPGGPPREDEYFWHVHYVDRGWPLTYLTLKFNQLPEPSVWTFVPWAPVGLTPTPPVFSETALAIDVAVALAILVLVVGLERYFRDYLPLRFSLAMILTLVTATCFVLGFIVYCDRVRVAEEEAIKLYEGRVEFTTRWQGWHICRILGGAESWPMFMRVHRADFANPPNGTPNAPGETLSADIVALRDFSHLRDIAIYVGGRLELESLRANAPGLRRIYISVGQQGTEELRELARFAELATLELHFGPFDDSHLMLFADCPQLTMMNVPQTSITDRGIAAFLTRRPLLKLSHSGKQNWPFFGSDNKIDYEKFALWKAQLDSRSEAAEAP